MPGPWRRSARPVTCVSCAGAWNQAYLEELCAFPLGSYADQVDASSGAFNKLSRSQQWSIAEIEAWGRNDIAELKRLAGGAVDPLPRDEPCAVEPDDWHAQWLKDVEAKNAEDMRRLCRGR